MTRKGCHLCDDAKATLLKVRAEYPFEFVETDVDKSEEQAALYGLEVPVVLVDGHKVAKFRIDEAALIHRLRCATRKE